MGTGNAMSRGPGAVQVRLHAGPPHKGSHMQYMQSAHGARLPQVSAQRDSLQAAPSQRTSESGSAGRQACDPCREPLAARGETRWRSVSSTGLSLLSLLHS